MDEQEFMLEVMDIEAERAKLKEREQAEMQSLAACFDDHPFSVLFATLGGSHVFGYASAWSDYDLGGVHLIPLWQVIGLYPGQETIERKSLTTHGLENPAEMVTHDLEKFLRLLLKSNGNALEILYSPLVIRTSPLHEELKVLARGCFTKLCTSHYKGMAYNQQRRLKENPLKQLIHVYRCLLMALHLMRTNELIMDIPALAETCQEKTVLQLIERKVSSRAPTITSEEIAFHQAEANRITEVLDAATAKSWLPLLPGEEVQQAMNALLVRERLK